MFGDLNMFFILPKSVPVVMAVVTLFACASYTDIMYHKVYNKMCLLFALLRLLMLPLYPISLQTVLGGVVGFMLLFIPAFILNTPHMAGDIKFSGVAGLWIGPIPSLFGLCIGLVLLVITAILMKKGKKDVLPFAPFMSLGYTVMLAVPYLTSWGSL